MPLEPLLPLFHRLNREHFEGTLTRGHQPLLAVRWSDGRLRRTAGFYRRGPAIAPPFGREIVLSKPLLDPLPREATESTLCHEMIHAWVDRVQRVTEVHGPQFRARMAQINAAQQEFEVSLRHSYPLPAVVAGWIAVCPVCGRTAAYRRRRQGLACRHCCEQHNGGRWDARFLLRFERPQEACSG